MLLRLALCVPRTPSAQAAQAVIAPWQPGMMNDRAASIDLSDRNQRLRHAATAPGK